MRSLRSKRLGAADETRPKVEVASVDLFWIGEPFDDEVASTLAVGPIHVPTAVASSIGWKFSFPSGVCSRLGIRPAKLFEANYVVGVLVVCYYTYTDWDLK